LQKIRLGNEIGIKIAWESIMKGFRWPSSKNSGFTFVELMVAVAVIAILAATAVPTIMNRLPDYRLRKAARDMYSHFQQARLQAVRMNTEFAVLFDNASNNYQLISGGPDGVFESIPPAAIPTDDDIVLNTTPLEGYGNGVRFGSGEAAQSVDGLTAFPPEVRWEYALGDYILFNPKGIVFETGYVYITNEDGTCFAVGSPSLSGTIVQRKWYTNGGWD
jgi:type IV fimbrial biogenesis protein FimT